MADLYAQNICQSIPLFKTPAASHISWLMFPKKIPKHFPVLGYSRTIVQHIIILIKLNPSEMANLFISKN